MDSKLVRISNGTIAPAQIKSFNVAINIFNLEFLLEDYDDPIDLSKVRLMGSHYLGPVNFDHKYYNVPTVGEVNLIKEFFSRVVERARRLSNHYGTTHFAVTSNIADRNQKPTNLSRDEEVSSQADASNHFEAYIRNIRHELHPAQGGKLEPEKLEYVLHPTAHLYLVKE